MYTLRDGDVFYKKNSTGQKVHCALYGIHALITSIQQEVFEIRYVRSSEERCILHEGMPLTSGLKHTSHWVLERLFFLKGVMKDIESVK